MTVKGEPKGDGILSKSTKQDAEKISSHSVDSYLSSLFKSSAGPILRPSPRTTPAAKSYDDAVEEHGIPIGLQGVSSIEPQSARKRKRRRESADIEDVYMQKIARQENERQDQVDGAEIHKELHSSDTSPQEEVEPEQLSENDSIAQRTEPLQQGIGRLGEYSTEEESDKALRTVFLSNVSSTAVISKSAKKLLLNHLSSFFPLLPPASASSIEPAISSIRFRSIAFSTQVVPKRAAFAKGELMDSTTNSTNAYVIYSSQAVAKEAVNRLNGTIVLDRHLRADSVASPSKTETRKCVFVGNLGFVNDDSTKANEPPKGSKKNNPPGDVEEGLWHHFSLIGKVNNVRVIRDPLTRVSKGFAYVQFEDENSVEAALQLNGQKLPPMLPRTLRVMRARSTAKKKPLYKSTFDKTVAQTKAHRRLPRDQQLLKSKSREHTDAKKADEGVGKSRIHSMRPPDTIFEGHRASISEKQRLKTKSSHGKRTVSLKKGPNGRESRASAWKRKRQAK